MKLFKWIRPEKGEQVEPPWGPVVVRLRSDRARRCAVFTRQPVARRFLFVFKFFKQVPPVGLVWIRSIRIGQIAGKLDTDNERFGSRPTLSICSFETCFFFPALWFEKKKKLPAGAGYAFCRNIKIRSGEMESETISLFYFLWLAVSSTWIGWKWIELQIHSVGPKSENCWWTMASLSLTSLTGGSIWLCRPIQSRWYTYGLFHCWGRGLVSTDAIRPLDHEPFASFSRPTDERIGSELKHFW